VTRCGAKTFSSNLAMNENVFIMEERSSVFFKTGVTAAVLITEGQIQ